MRSLKLFALAGIAIASLSACKVRLYPQADAWRVQPTYTTFYGAWSKCTVGWTACDSPETLLEQCVLNQKSNELDCNWSKEAQKILNAE
jgi:hypothetical protein